MIIVQAANQSAMEFIEGRLPNRIYFIWKPTSQPRELVEGAAAQHIIVWAADLLAMEFIEGWLPNRIYFIWQLTGQPRELVEGAAAQ